MEKMLCRGEGPIRHDTAERRADESLFPSYTATQRDEADESDQRSVETSGEAAHDKPSQVFLQARPRGGVNGK